MLALWSKVLLRRLRNQWTNKVNRPNPVLFLIASRREPGMALLLKLLLRNNLGLILGHALTCRVAWSDA